MIYIRFLLIALCLVLLPASTQAQTQDIIRNIRVDGTQRIEPQTVVSYLNIGVGDPMTRPTLNRGLKNLFATGLFADVTLRQDQDTLVVEVSENPVINRIAFEGNERIEDGELQAEIQLRPRQVFTRTKVQNDVTRLYQVYRRNGRFSVKIDPKVIKLDQNRVDLVFEVEEGDVTKVESIRFVGNRRFSDDRLRSEITTKEQAWYRFISSDDRYDPDRLAFDQELLRRFYLSEGYADFQVTSAVAELSNDRSDFYVTFTVEEGPRYKFGEVNIDSQLRDFDSAVLQPLLEPIYDEKWYNAERVQKVVDTITDDLGDRQYAFVSVRPNTEKNRETKIVDLTFTINEAPRTFVERINVNGNVRTLDKVVRREMLLVEGDPFNKSKIQRSEQNIRDLDYFETVDLQVKPGSAPDKTEIDLDVTEKSTGELSIGAGFSTNDGPLADFRIRERNFLGKGQDLLFSTVLAGERTEFNVAFTEPHFLDRDVSAGFDAFHTTRDFQDESSYDQRRSGGGLRFGYPLSEKWRQTWRYRLERNEITDVQSDASRFILDQEGERDTSAISQRLAYDSLDSRTFPTRGWSLWLDTELAGLGGDAKYVSGKTGGSYYYPFTDKWILNILGEVGAIEGYSDSDVEINERFFIGGSTLRGFERAGIGPRDISTGDALGGNLFYRGTAETSFPVGLPEELGVMGHLFSDFGTLYTLDDTGAGIVDESSIRVSAGVGMSWRSPFGPIRLDFSAPIAKEDFDEKEVFRFDFGTRF